MKTLKTNNINIKIWIYPFILFLATLISCQPGQNKNDLNNILATQIDSMRIILNFPAVTYGVIRNDSILVLNAVGYRDIETKEKVQPEDYFHIGSNTKSFTAFLSGRLVDEGYIKWDTKFFDLYPELKSNSNPVYHKITLQQLLSHRAGLIGFKHEPEVSIILSEYESGINEGLSINEKRYHLIKHILKKEPLPLYDQCEDCYSNAGFIAAGLMLEKVTNKTWEELIMNLSNDLELGIHIGWPVDYNPGQPKGHINPKYWVLDIEKDLVPISDQLRMYHNFNQFGLLTAPSGNISITTEKFLEYLRLHLEGFNGADNSLKSETYKHILTAFPKYSHGWWVDEINGVTEYSHRGSNGTFYSFAGLFPENNTGIVVMINTYKEEGLTDIINIIEEAVK